MNGIHPTKLRAARDRQIARIYQQQGAAMAVGFARATGADSIALAALLADLRDKAEQPSDDDRGDELATHERDDRFAGA
jgi:hypothetical protein